jgi:SAM-dependent methyltransferase
MQHLHFNKKEILKQAPKNFIKTFIQQQNTERRYRKDGVHFRTTAPEKLASAYSAMDSHGFQAINGRQEWANWRTIPLSLSGNIPNHPLFLIDLGCGIGASTEVLAYYLPLGSEILGIELNPQFVQIASERTFFHQSHSSIKTTFSCQNLQERFRSPSYEVVSAETVDYINSSGVVGHHFNRTQFQLLTQELKRVLRPQGVLALDVGPTLSQAQMRSILEPLGFSFLKRVRCSFFDPYGQALFKKQAD